MPAYENELITIARRILNLGTGVPGVIVEAGAFHGGSTAKLSLVAKLANRTFHVFDSFEGVPENAEAHGKSIYGREHHFPKGSHAVPLDEVRNNVTDFGDISLVEFHKGFFANTMPHFHKPVAAACVNVDLVQSTKDCLRYLYPLTSSGGVLFSQDAHFPWIIKLLNDEVFWGEGDRHQKTSDDGPWQFKARCNLTPVKKRPKREIAGPPYDSRLPLSPAGPVRFSCGNSILQEHPRQNPPCRAL